MSCRAVLLCAVLASSGCVAEDSTGGPDAGGPDGGPDIDADPLAPDAMPGVCDAIPDTAPAWLGGYLSDAVAKLAGGAQLPGGTVLSERFSDSSRAAVRAYLTAELESFGYTVQLDSYGTGVNVYAELASTEGGSDYVVFGAHYDTVPASPGANDNATGVAAVLAAARWFRDVDCREQNIVFVLFDEEEFGLIGSRAFASLLVVDSYDVSTVHTIDQMGWDNDGDRAIELELPTSAIYDSYVAARTAGGFNVPITETTTAITDHTAFRERGYAATGITEEYVSGDTTPHYHQASDIPATVNQAYLRSTASFVMYTLARLVRGEG